MGRPQDRLFRPRPPAAKPRLPLRGQALEARPGERVLDLCGGAGLKAFYLAAQGAEVVSYDLNRRRQEAGARTARRLGLWVHYRTQDLTRPVPERAKKVLLDAPCTGTGTFRAHPELRYRLSPEDPARMAALQLQLLETAAQATEEGGFSSTASAP